LEVAATTLLLIRHQCMEVVCTVEVCTEAECTEVECMAEECMEEACTEQVEDCSETHKATWKR
jgi:hypothetical protein